MCRQVYALQLTLTVFRIIWFLRWCWPLNLQSHIGCLYVCVHGTLSPVYSPVCRYIVDSPNYWVPGKEEDHGYRVHCVHGRIPTAIHLHCAVSLLVYTFLTRYCKIFLQRRLLKSYHRDIVIKLQNTECVIITWMHPYTWLSSPPNSGDCISGSNAIVWTISLLFPYRDVITLFLFFIRAFATGAFQVLFVYTPEVYPTSVRGTAMGCFSASSRIGAIITPFVAQVFQNIFIEIYLWTVENLQNLQY